MKSDIKYFFRKLMISFEFLIVLMFATNWYPNILVKFNNIILKEKSWGIFAFILPSFLALLKELYFPFKDKSEVIADFPKKRKIYITNLVSVFYFCLFVGAFLGSYIYEDLIGFGFNKLFPLYSILGIAILLFSLIINALVFNLLLRDNS